MDTTTTGNLAVIPKPRASHFVEGGPTVVDRAVAKGVIKPHRTPTGREYLTPYDFEALVRFSRGGDAQER
jgi:hypothetical protein